jgi:hypothetical protein
MALIAGQVPMSGYRTPDYTGVAEASARPMQAMAGMVGQVGDYFKQQGEKKKLIKQSDVQIDAALKLFPDLAPSLQGYRDQLKDENLPLDDRMAIADSVSNVINMGIGEMRNAQKTLMQQQRMQMEAQVQGAKLGMEERRTRATEYGAMQAAGELKETEISIFDPEIGKERKEKVLLDKQGQYYERDTKRPILNTEKFFYGEEGGLGELPPTSQIGGSASDLIAGAANGTFNISYKTRDQLPASSPTSRQISLDFNAAANKNAKGIEIIIPNNATDEERQRAQEYVAKTQQYFAERGVNVPVRGVRTAKENGRGTPNRFHTEPFFVGDAASRAVMEKDPDGYAQVLASTLGRIPGAMFIPPHKSNDPGASDGKFNERDFAKGSIIPALERLSKQKSAQANPAGIDNAISMTGDMTQQAMGTPEQQAMLSQQIEQGAGMAMAQNIPQGAMPTEPSMATQQPQLPQQAAPQWSPPKGFVPKQGKFRQFTPEEVTQYGSQGQVNIETGEVRPIRPPSGMVIEQTSGGGFRVVQGSGVGGRQEQAAQAAKEQGAERATMGTQEIGRALKVLDSGVMQGSGPLASFYRAGAARFVKGTPEYQLANNFIAPIKSMLAFNELNKMRMASPTGGALGNVAKFETDMLQQSAGQLDIDKTDPQTLRENLMRLQGKYLDVIHGTSEQRRKLLQDGKITKEQYFDIESSYPAFTMSEVGETVPRQIEAVTPQAQESEADIILRELGE